jgi:hypothetical protein
MVDVSWRNMSLVKEVVGMVTLQLSVMLPLYLVLMLIKFKLVNEEGLYKDYRVISILEPAVL